jgi:biopolymer transport protein ExbD
MNLRSKSKVSAEFSMSSMTDLVFLLLIFFMLTSSIVTTTALDVTLPKSKAQTVNRENVVVQVGSDLKYKVDGEEVSISALESSILNSVAGKEDAVVLLAVDGSIPTDETVRVLDIGYRNGLKMTLATDGK